MPRYHYHARDQKGKVVSGYIEADNEQFAADILRDRGFSVIDLILIKKRLPEITFLQKVGVKDFAIFARQLSILINAKIPLVDALRTLTRQTANKYLKEILAKVADEVEGGVKLSEAFAHYPKVFNNFFVQMIRSGETIGKLDEVLNYLADQQEKDYDLISRIRGAMIYPVFIILAMLGVGIAMLIFVIPQLTSVLQESGGELPFSTKLLISISSFFANYWIWLLILLILAILGFRLLLRQKPVRIAWDNFKIRIPIVGKIYQKIYLVRLARSLETLLSGGVEIVEALKIVALVVGNFAYQELILQTAQEVAAGNSITSVFQKSKLIPPMVNQLLAVGEETGRMQEILGRLTNFYSREVDNSVSNLVSVIEPLIMIVIGVAVGLMVSAIILPMYRLASQF